jgi:hypothetical protein
VDKDLDLLTGSFPEGLPMNINLHGGKNVTTIMHKARINSDFKSIVSGALTDSPRIIDKGVYT